MTDQHHLKLLEDLGIVEPGSTVVASFDYGAEYDPVTGEKMYVCKDSKGGTVVCTSKEMLMKKLDDDFDLIGQYCGTALDHHGVKVAETFKTEGVTGKANTPTAK